MSRYHRSPGRRLQQVFVTVLISGSVLFVPARLQVPAQESPGAAALSVPLEVDAAPAALEAVRAPDAAAAGAQFDVTWSTSCATPPPSAVIALDHAADLWGSWLGSPVTIVVTACWTTITSEALADGEPVSYHSNFVHAPLVDVVYPVALANALAGVDLDPTGGDIRMHFQSGESWDFTLDGTGAGTYDFVSVALHELAHGLGFIGDMYVSYNVAFCGTGLSGYLYPCPTPYDFFAVDGTGTPLLSYIDSNPLTAGASLQSDTRFGGPNTVAENEGAAQLYTPGLWEQGSSLSHLNLGTFQLTGNRLMTHVYSGVTHVPGPVTLAMLQDMGWPRNDGVPNLATSGGAAAGVARSVTFDAATSWPAYAGQLLTYTWTTAGGIVVHAGRGLTDTVALAWGGTGVKTITATVSRGAISASATRSVLVVAVGLTGATAGDTNKDYSFSAALVPSNTALPVTYTWMRTGSPTTVVHRDLGTADSAAFSWSTPGAKVVTVTATLGGAAIRAVHGILITGLELDQHVFLPLVLLP